MTKQMNWYWLSVRFWGRAAQQNLRLAVIFLSLLVFLAPAAEAKRSDYLPMTTVNCVRAILGEARGEGYQGMLAHAYAIRNRGTLKGVYGAQKIYFGPPAVRWTLGPCYYERLETFPENLISVQVQEDAKNAWEASAFGRDITRGATHWLSDYDRAHMCKWQSWINDYESTVRVGETVFYKKRQVFYPLKTWSKLCSTTR
jgi:hypothetical protein